MTSGAAWWRSICSGIVFKVRVVHGVKRDQKKEEQLSRVAPAASLLIPQFSRAPLLSPAGDLSKVQWPAALQYLNLDRCYHIEGRFQPRLNTLVPPTNTNEHDRTPLVRPQPHPSSFLILTQSLLVLFSRIFSTQRPLVAPKTATETCSTPPRLIATSSGNG